MAKNWFITGASGGLGAALAKAVIRNGDRVAATFRKTEQAAAFTEQNKGSGLGLVLDVTDEAGHESAIADAEKAFGPIDVLVNNAGYGTTGAIEAFTMEEIRAQLETNFFAAAALTKRLLPAMRERGQGWIVQLSSIAGFRATPGFGVYNASKFALEGFSEALAQEVAPFGIRVLIVEPGPFRTEFLGSSMRPAAQRLQAYAEGPVAQTYQYMESMNGKQEGDPEKAASAIVQYVNDGKENLRLPLGKVALQAIHAKLAAVQKDLDANGDIAASTVF